MALIEVENVVKLFGGLVALDGVGLSVDSGEIHGVIGPNGAGKTTLFNVINGMYTTTSGSIRFKGRDITNKSPSAIAKQGIGRTFQVARIFDNMSVLENMLVPAIPIRLSPSKAKQRALELLDQARLSHLADQPATEISGGQRKLLEFFRAMMGDPELMLLDEPFNGVNPSLIAELSAMVQHMNREMGKTFLLISHDIPNVNHLCERVTVLVAGANLTSGTPEQVREDPRVIEAYLGE